MDSAPHHAPLYRQRGVAMAFDLSTIFDLVGTGVKVYGALSSGQDAADIYDAQATSSLTEARRALVDAASYRDVAGIQAGKTRRQGGDVVSQARASPIVAVSVAKRPHAKSISPPARSPTRVPSARNPAPSCAVTVGA